jgi:uncharacterized membrane protein
MGMTQLSASLRFDRKAWKGLVFLAVGLLFFGWLLNTPGGLLGKADAVGYAVCHRIDLRSYHLGVRQLPLCARCTGMYLGAVLALVYQGHTGRRKMGTPPRSVLVVLGILVLAFAVDGLNSFLHLAPLMQLFPNLPRLYTPDNTLRLLTGTGMGLAMAAALYPAFNQTVWQDWQPEPALAGLRSMGALLSLAFLVDLLVLSDNPLILYPLALISAAGVLLLLSMVYSMVWLMVLRAENRILRLQELVLPLTGGFALALLQIILLDAARFMLTHTWGGFTLG